MKNDIYNSIFENMLHVVLLLSASKIRLNEDRIATYDFMCIYGEKCGIAKYNLNGNSSLNFSEFTQKRIRIKEAIKFAVINDYIQVITQKDGFSYLLSNKGNMLAEKLNSSYASDYIYNANKIFDKYNKYTDQEFAEEFLTLSRKLSNLSEEIL